MTSIFYVYASQELYQSTEPVHQELTQLERIFPQNPFLTTQRALLFYHSKGLIGSELHLICVNKLIQITTKPNQFFPPLCAQILIELIAWIITPTSCMLWLRGLNLHFWLR